MKLSILQLASFKINGHFSSQFFRYHRGSLNLNRNLLLLTDFFKFFFKSSSLIAETTTGLFRILTCAGLAAFEFGFELTGELGAVLDFLFLFFLALFFSTLKSPCFVFLKLTSVALYFFFSSYSGFLLFKACATLSISFTLPANFLKFSVVSLACTSIAA